MLLEIFGYIASLAIGISLGIIGGGGSILTLPVLVYLFGIAPVTATAYSLFIVGFSSLVGAWPKYRQGEVHLRTALIFGLPSILAVFAARKFLVPLIPEIIFRAGDFAFTRNIMMMVLFAVLMIFAALSMIRRGEEGAAAATGGPPSYNYPLIIAEGLLVGLLTGLVGAGGGFLIIPALVLLSKLPMKTAVGTSLLIIAAKSLIGFTGDLSHTAINWPLLGIITLLATAGIFIGHQLSKKVDGDKLQKGFGWFVLVMGIYIIVKEMLT
jgi:hypothetical protein